jgi:hypothetical protein
MKTVAEREARRQTWIDPILDALPADQRTPTVRETLTGLVHIDIWRGEESFEDANFTDLQLATAIATLDSRARQAEAPWSAPRQRDTARRHGTDHPGTYGAPGFGAGARDALRFYSPLPAAGALP